MSLFFRKVTTILIFLTVGAGQVLAENAPTLPLQGPVLTSLAFSTSQVASEARQLRKGLDKSTKKILRKELRLRHAISRYITLHSVPGKLRYLDAPISWEDLVNDGDVDGAHHLIDVFMGKSTSLRPLSKRVECPQEQIKTICILRISVFNAGKVTLKNLTSKAHDKSRLLPKFMRQVAALAPNRMAMRIRGKIDFNADTGEIFEKPPNQFNLKRNRIYDDVFQAGVTAEILPASARDREWLYGINTTRDWSLSKSAKNFDVWVEDNLLFPGGFTGNYLAWSLNDVGQALGRRNLVSDRSLEDLLKNIKPSTLQEAAVAFREGEEVFVQIEFDLQKVNHADAQLYEATSKKKKDYWKPSTVFFTKIVRVTMTSNTSGNTFNLPLK